MKPDILCIGACHWDVIGRTALEVTPGADLPGEVTLRPGGVAFNVASAIAREGLAPQLLTAVGRDADGDALIGAARAAGIGCASVRRADHPTGRYLAIEGPDGLVAAIADARGLEAAGQDILAPLRDGTLATPARPWTGCAVIDGNLGAATLSALAGPGLLREADIRVVSASAAKAGQLRAFLGAPVTLYLNRAEAGALLGRSFPGAREAAEAAVAVGVRRAVVTDGAGPAADAMEGVGVLVASPPMIGAIAGVTGAGDRFVAAHVAASLRGLGRVESLNAALAAAARHVAGQPG